MSIDPIIARRVAMPAPQGTVATVARLLAEATSSQGPSINRWCVSRALFETPIAEITENRRARLSTYTGHLHPSCFAQGAAETAGNAQIKKSPAEWASEGIAIRPAPMARIAEMLVEPDAAGTSARSAGTAQTFESPEKWASDGAMIFVQKPAQTCRNHPLLSAMRTPRGRSPLAKMAQLSQWPPRRGVNRAHLFGRGHLSERAWLRGVNRAH